MPQLSSTSKRSAAAGETVSIYMDYLQVKSPERFVGLNELTKTDPVPDTYVQDVVLPAVERAIEEKKGYVFIPIKLEDGSMTLFTINLENPALEFYNPKGGFSGGQKIRAMNLTVEGFRAQLSGALFTGLGDRLAVKHNPDLIELREYLSQEVTNENHDEFKKGLVALLEKPGTQLRSSPIYPELWKLNRQKKPEYYQKAEELYQILDKAPSEAKKALREGRWHYDPDLEAGVRDILRDIVYPHSATVERRPDLQGRFKQHIRKVIDEQTSLKGNLYAKVDYLLQVDGSKRNPFGAVRHIFNNQKPKGSIDRLSTGVYVSKYMEERLSVSPSERGFNTTLSKLQGIQSRETRSHMADVLSDWYGSKNLEAS